MSPLFSLSLTKEQLDVVVYAINEVPLPGKVYGPLANALNEQIQKQLQDLPNAASAMSPPAPSRAKK